MINQDWLKRRFYDFRNGHGSYLAYFIAFLQFMIISYQLYIENTPFVKAVFPRMEFWLLFFVCTYIPAAIYVGHRIHLKSQYKNEVKQLADKNPYTYEAMPGKEKDYSLPANKLSYELQIKNMQMHNQNADIGEKAWRDLFNYDVKLPRYTEADFAAVQYYLNMTIRLQRGENITDIIETNKARLTDAKSVDLQNLPQ